MTSSLDKYKKDIEALVKKGESLLTALEARCYPAQLERELEAAFEDEADREKWKKALPDFERQYQGWYSESQALIRLILPDRLADFIRHYEKPKTRKSITFESYRIEDCLQGVHVTSGYAKEKVVGRDAAIPHFRQQLAMLSAAKGRFDSSLFDIKQLLQADLFDSELDAARHLLKNKFARAAGALAGVVLERHLGQVCTNHGLAMKRKNPTMADFYDALKDASVIETPEWRSIQYLADIRNLCDHGKKVEPSEAQVGELIAGADRISKTLY